MNRAISTFFFAGGTLLLVVLGMGAPTDTTNSRPRAKSFADYEIVLQRNIFDPNRSGSRRYRNSGADSGPVSDQVQLVGTWLTDRQVIAFLEGNRPGYSGTTALGGGFDGWRFADITTQHVVLVKGPNKIVWPVGQRIERNGKGDWQLAGASSSPMQPAASGPSTPSTLQSEGAAKDMLQLMRERRQREMSKQ